MNARSWHQGLARRQLPSAFPSVCRISTVTLLARRATIPCHERIPVHSSSPGPCAERGVPGARSGFPARRGAANISHAS